MPSKLRKPPPPSDAPRRPVRTSVVPMTIEGYPTGLHAVMRINPPMRDYESLSTDTRGTMRRLIVEWNLPDEDGAVVEIDDTLSGATDEELAALLAAWYDALKARATLPKA